MNSEMRTRLPRTFWWANLTQFGGAMNDNLFKLFMIYALLEWKGAESSANILASVGLTFALPFLLIIPIAGSFADHYSKQWMIVRLKAAEVVVMGFGIFALAIGSAPLLYVTMLLMSGQSAFFGPCKYGIIPEMVDAERLSKANGMLQLFTFLAIIAGTIIAPELSLLLQGQYAKAASICLLVALVGFLASLKIESTPSHTARKLNFNGFVNLLQSTRDIRKDGFLTLAILATAFFSLIGAFIQLNVLDYGAQHLDLLPEQATRLFLLTAIGIGAGSVFAGWISGRSIEFGIVPIGAGLMFIGLIALGTIPHGQMWIAALSMFLLGLAAGMFIVPLESFIQYRSPGDKVGSIKAAGGFLSWIGILTASGLIFLSSAIMDLPAQGGFLLISILLLILTVFSLWILPDFLVKFIVMVLTRSLYRLRVYGLDNLPHDRAALLVANHASLMDAMLLISSQQRRIRMLMSRNVYNSANTFAKWVVRISGVILVQDTDGPKQLIKSLQDARKALDDGFLVCIFAEGGLTMSGMMRPFKPGFERIVKGSNHPIVPVYIGGAWGGVTSWRFGKPQFNPLREYRRPVSVHFGREMPATSTGFAVRQAVCELSTELHRVQKQRRVDLCETFVRSARKYGQQPAIFEETKEPLSYEQLLEAVFSAQVRLRQLLKPEDRHVGVLSSQGMNAAIANLALTLDGRIPVNLDPTREVTWLAGKLEDLNIQAVIISQDCLDSSKGELSSVQLIHINDLVHDVPASSGTSNGSKAPKPPQKLVFDPGDTAAILLTAGRKGEPRAIELSHQNILSSIDSIATLIKPSDKTCIIGTLPFHNAFGFVLTLWLPLLAGIRVNFIKDPADASSVAEAASAMPGAILPTTPALLEQYLQSIDPGKFESLGYLFTGGSKLTSELATQVQERFGITPLEAYGATELTGLCALSLPDIQVSRLKETAQREGFQGRLLPGIAMKIVDPDSGKECPPGEVGIVCIKGSIVAKGCLGSTSNSLASKDGWYRTDDYGRLDTDGFFAIEEDPINRENT